VVDGDRHARFGRLPAGYALVTHWRPIRVLMLGLRQSTRSLHCVRCAHSGRDDNGGGGDVATKKRPGISRAFQFSGKI
jgi:hypothetical protein